MIPTPDFSQHAIFSGREEELSTLKTLLEQTKTKGRAHICYINGASGTGKSGLVREFIIRTRQNNTSVFVGAGKFNSSVIEEPFGVIAVALQQLLNEVVRDDALRSILKEQLEAELANGEWRILGSLIDLDAVMPSLRRSNACVIDQAKEAEVIDQEGVDNKNAQAQDNQEEHGFERLSFAFRGLLRACINSCAKGDGMAILFLDDLQWTPKEAWAVLETMLKDTQQPILVLGAHRSDAGTSWMAPDKQLTIDNLSLEAIKSLLYKLFRREDTDDLAVLVQRYTHGNAFFVNEFLQVLIGKQLLTYSVQELSWTWNCHLIQAEVSLSDNLVNLVAGRIQESPALPILMLAATLELTFFDLDLINATISVFEDLSPLDVTERLEQASKDALVEQLTTTQFKFAHDKIRETAQAILPQSGEKRYALHLKLGKILKEKLERKDLLQNKKDRTLLLATTQLNKVQDHLSISERDELAKLNLRSAEHLMDQAAFFPAVEFLKTADALIGSDWVSWHRDLILGIKNGLAKSLFNCGRVAESIEVADLVIDRSKNFAERATAYHLKIQSQVQQGQKKEAIKTISRVYKELGLNFPRRWFSFHAIKLFLEVRGLLKNKSKEDILSLPPNTSKNVEYIGEFCERLGEIAALWGDDDLLGIAILTSVKLTLEHGLYPVSGLGFLGYGLVLIEQGDFDGGYMWGNVGLEIAKQGKGLPVEVRTIGIYYIWAWHFKEPFQNGLAPLQEVMKKLWDAGSLYYIFMDSNSVLRAYYCCGLELGPLLDDIKQYNSLLQDYRQETVLNMQLPMMQMVANLAGTSDHTVELTGEYMTEDTFLDLSTRTKQDGALQMLHLHKVIVGIYFEDDLVVQHHVRRVKRMFLEGSECYIQMRFFYKGVGGFLSKYRKIGRSMLKVFETWVRHGNVNAHHMLMILRALDASFRISKDRNKRSADVVQAFEAAAVAAGRLGFLHHQALANHLAARHFWRSDKEVALGFFRQAMTSYEAWGAFGVVNYLKSKYQPEDPQPASRDNLQQSVTHLGRRRLSDLSSLRAHDKNKQILEGRQSFGRQEPTLHRVASRGSPSGC